MRERVGRSDSEQLAGEEGRPALAAPAHATLSWPVRLGYAAGSVGTGVYSTVPGILLLFFMTQTLALPVALAPLAVLAPKLVIVCAEPLIGVWSDRTRTRWGRRAPFLLAGALLSAAAFVALFSVPRLGGAWITLGAVGGAYLAASLAFSLFAVPYVAMPPELSPSRDERTRIIGLRMGFVFGGVLLGAAGAPLIVQRFGGGAGGYRAMAVLVGLVSLTPMLVSFATVLGLRREGMVLPSSALPPMRALRHRPYLVALALYVLIMVGFGAMSAAAAYFVAFTLDRPSEMLAWLLGAQLVTALAAVGPWSWAVPRLGFAGALGAAVGCGLVGSALFYAAARSGDIGVALAASVAMGLASAGVQVAAFGLLADITGRACASGLQAEGLMTGLWTAAEKVALALGPVITGCVLAAGGFVSAADRAHQPPSAIAAAGWAMTLAPGALFALALVALAVARPYIDAMKPIPLGAEHAASA